ncbi:MAG TPA: formate dehydrogenase subunit alpha [Spirochaetia bacterium]|nr:formate dehydrogenase subunit alpha [Spirochaetia bacterium]
MESIPVTIDGRVVNVEPGATVLQAAEAAGIRIPHLCHEPRLKPSGGCRLCLVEIKGQPGFQTACARPVQEGMVVSTATEAVRSLRRSVLEMLVSEHRMSCSTCDRDGDCLLQDYAYEYQVDEKRFASVPLPPGERNYTTESLAISYDPSKCIRCQRCIRICEEVQGVEALTLASRGTAVLVTTGFQRVLQETSCELCGQCIGTCPTAALHEKAARGKGKPKDLDRVRTTCPYCGVGCQVDLNVSRASNLIVRVTAEQGVVPNDGLLCVKGRFGMDFVGRGDRLTQPLIRDNGSFRAASWEEALGFTAERLLAIRGTRGPDALAVLASAKTTNEDNYIMQKLARAGFGTNNVDHCARLCHASTVAGLAMAFGSGAMTNSIDELHDTPLIFVIGSNTTECHPVIGLRIRQAVASGRTTLIVADPRRISLAGIADLHLRHRPGTDVALLNAMMSAIVEEGLENRDFILTRTENFDQVRAAVAACPPEVAAKITGVPAGDIRKAARMYASAKSAAIVYSMGITQHATGTDNVLSVANLAMMTGNLGREHAGVNPLRGQNNVQGACDMGALPNVYSGYQRVDDAAVRQKFQAAWDVDLPQAPGLTVVEMMHAAEAGRIRGMYIMGENPVLSDPDIAHVRSALEALDFLVVQDIFLSETAELADVVLPAFSFAEKDGTFTNTERRVQRIRRAVRPPGDAREDWRILCDVSTRMGYPMAYRDSSAIMDEIASTTSIYGGISYDRLEGAGLQWPCPTRSHPGTPVLHRENFTRGKGRFHAVQFMPPRELPDTEFPFLLTTGRLLPHFHTGTMTRRCDVLEASAPHGTLELNPADAEALALHQGETAVVRSRRGRIEIPVAVTQRVDRGTVFVAFHFKEHPANALTIAALDPVAKIPEFKACAVAVEKQAADS